MSRSAGRPALRFLCKAAFLKLLTTAKLHVLGTFTVVISIASIVKMGFLGSCIVVLGCLSLDPPKRHQ